MWTRFRHLLARPTDPASLGAFRIWFGACLVVEVVRFFYNDWIAAQFIQPVFFFSYPGFEWVRPWPGYDMYGHFVVLGIAALAVALGLFYRVAALVAFLGFTYVFLLDEANYLNHFYLISLLALLLMWMPAHRWSAIDAQIARRRAAERPLSSRHETPDLATPQAHGLQPVGFTTAAPAPSRPNVPFWPVFLLRAQLFIVYLYAAIAKMDGDWLAGYPMAMWLDDPHVRDIWLIGPWLGTHQAAVFLSWAGLFFDLSIGPLLLWRRTRLLGLALAFGFHFMNIHLFHIGIFPWLMMGATLIFDEPDWPRRLTRMIARRFGDVRWFLAFAGSGLIATYLLLDRLMPRDPTSRFHAPGAIVTATLLLGFLVLRWRTGREPLETANESREASDDADFVSRPSTRDSRRRPLAHAATALIALWLAVQVLVPLRHWLYPGDVHWTEEGHILSWRMKLREKYGRLQYVRVTNPVTGQSYDHDPLLPRRRADGRIAPDLTPRQFGKMLVRPRMILRYVHWIAAQYEQYYGVRPEIRVDVQVSLNGRDWQQFIDPARDLAAVPLSLAPADWIVPLTTPLNERLGAPAAPSGADADQ